MTAGLTDSRRAGAVPPEISGPPRTVAPIKWFAAAGAAFGALQVYVLIRWITSGQATPTLTGKDPVPVWVHNTALTCDIVAPILAALVVWHYLIQPWRRAGHLTVDGMLIIAWLSVYLLQDGWLNYTQTWFLYNSAHTNFGSWYSQVPGWTSPNGHLLPEPIFFWGGVWISVGFTATVLVCAIMRRFQARYPQTGRFGLAMVALACMVVVDVAVEVPMLRAHLYSYAGSIRSVSLFPGTTYQFPIYANLLWAFMWTGMTCLRFFRDDRGRTLVERGDEHLRVTGWKSQLVRLAAVVGFAHLLMLTVYNVPMQWFATHAEAFPSDTPSWLVNGMCGPGTGSNCPGIGQPISRDDQQR
jgi:Spirocyclase AveC-like